MNDQSQKRCELFIKNRDAFKNGFMWEYTSIHHMAALLYTNQGKNVDIAQVKSCKKMIKEKCNAFSYFRSMSNLTLSTLLSLESAPEEMISKVLRAYDILKGQFISSEYLPFAAYNLAKLASESEFSKIASDAHEIYTRMKEKHFFLTGQEDQGITVLLALSKKDPKHIIEESERCYKILSTTFHSKNGVQGLSFVLTLSEQEAKDKCNKILSIHNVLRTQGYKYGKHHELSSLGIFALLEISVNEIVNSVIEIDNYLKTQKGFGIFGIGEKQRLMYAAMLAMDNWMEEKNIVENIMFQSVTEVLIAEQIAMCACIASTSAAATAAATST